MEDSCEIIPQHHEGTPVDAHLASSPTLPQGYTDGPTQALEDEAYLIACNAESETREAFEQLQKTRGFVEMAERDIETLEVTKRELQDMLTNADRYRDEYFDVTQFCGTVAGVWSERKESDWAPSSTKTVRLFPNASSILEQKESHDRMRRDRSLVDRAQLELRHPHIYKRVTQDEERRRIFQAAMTQHKSEREPPSGLSPTRQLLLQSQPTAGSPMGRGAPKHLLTSADGSSTLCVDQSVVTEAPPIHATLTPHASRMAILTANSSRPGSRAAPKPKANDARLPRLGQGAPRGNTLSSTANNYETSAIRATLGSAFAVNPSARTPQVERAMLLAQESARQRRAEKERMGADEDQEDAPELDNTCRPGGTPTSKEGILESAEEDVSAPHSPFDRDGGPSRGGLRLVHVKHDNLSRLLAEQQAEMSELDRKRRVEYEPVLEKYMEYHDVVHRKLDAIAKSGVMDNPNERGVGSKRQLALE